MKKQPRISRPNSAVKSARRKSAPVKNETPKQQSTLSGWVVSSSSEKKRRKVSADEEVWHNATTQDSPGTNDSPVLLNPKRGEDHEDQEDQTMGETEEVVDDSQDSEYENDDSQLVPAFRSVRRKVQSSRSARRRTSTSDINEIQMVAKETELDHGLADQPHDVSPPEDVPNYPQLDTPAISSSISRRTLAPQRPRPIPTLHRQTSTDLMPPPPTTPKRRKPLPDEIPNSQSPVHSPLRTQHTQTPSGKGKEGATGRIIKSSQWWDNDTQLETQHSEGEKTPNRTPRSGRETLVPFLDRRDSIGLDVAFKTPQAKRIRSQIPPTQDDDEGPLSTQVTPVKVKVMPNGSPTPNKFLEAQQERENSPTPRRRIRSLIPGTPHEEPLSSASEDNDRTPTQRQITSPWKSKISENEKTPIRQRHSEIQPSSPLDQSQNPQPISPAQGAGKLPQTSEVSNADLDSSESDEEMAFSLGTPFKSSSIPPIPSSNMPSQSQTPRAAADSIRIPPSYNPLSSPLKRPNFHPTPVITSPTQAKVPEPDSIRIPPSYNTAISPIKGNFSPPLSRISEGGEESQAIEGITGNGESRVIDEGPGTEVIQGAQGSESNPTNKAPTSDQPSIFIPPSYLTPISPLRSLHPHRPDLSAIPQSYQQSQSQPQPQPDSVYFPPSYVPQISPLLTAPQTSPQGTGSSSKGAPQFWTARSAATATTRGPASIWGTAVELSQTVDTQEDMANVVGVKETQMGLMETKTSGGSGGEFLVPSSQISQPSGASQLGIEGGGDEDEDMTPGDMVPDTLAAQWGSEAMPDTAGLDGDVDGDGDVDIVRDTHAQLLSSQLPAPVVPLAGSSLVGNNEDEDEEEEIMETPQLPQPTVPSSNSQRIQSSYPPTTTEPFQTAESGPTIRPPPRRAPARRFSQQLPQQQESQQLPPQPSRQNSKSSDKTPVLDSDATRSSEDPAGHQYFPNYDGNEDEEMGELDELDGSQLVGDNWDYTQDPDLSMFNPVRTQQIPDSFVFGRMLPETEGQDAMSVEKQSMGLLDELQGEEQGKKGGKEQEVREVEDRADLDGYGKDKHDWRVWKLNRRGDRVVKRTDTLDDWADKQCDKYAQEMADKMADEMAAKMAAKMADKMADEMADKMADEMAEEMMFEMLQEQEAEEAAEKAREEERFARSQKVDRMDGTPELRQQDNTQQEEVEQDEGMLPPLRTEKHEDVPRQGIPRRPNFLTTSQLLPDSLMDSFPPPPLLSQEENMEEKERDYDSDETQ